MRQGFIAISTCMKYCISGLLYLTFKWEHLVIYSNCLSENGINFFHVAHTTQLNLYFLVNNLKNKVCSDTFSCFFSD